MSSWTLTTVIPDTTPKCGPCYIIIDKGSLFGGGVCVGGVTVGHNASFICDPMLFWRLNQGWSLTEVPLY